MPFWQSTDYWRTLGCFRVAMNVLLQMLFSSDSCVKVNNVFVPQMRSYQITEDVLICKFDSWLTYWNVTMTHVVDSNKFVVICCVLCLPSVLSHCWLGVRKSIWPVKNWVMRCCQKVKKVLRRYAAYPLPVLTDIGPVAAASKHTTTSINHTRPSPS